MSLITVENINERAVRPWGEEISWLQNRGESWTDEDYSVAPDEEHIAIPLHCLSVRRFSSRNEEGERNC